MANKPEFVDTIGDRTQQRWRRAQKRAAEPVVEERSRLSHWPPQNILDWRLENLTPWRIKDWRERLWGSK
jgi:hypothetical protein